ncbi:MULTISPECIES: hypothetical protein [Bacillus]|uniref:hypothetical protein n=1 Tax=Bacillus TaxID=1386 RepID=UPI00227E4664|nr:hypothetical protein [Bacillus haynesii]MCY9372225.1 hypothetical protein [Bacillus haynesii]MEC0722830.1 hypothetical protein [Bacillus haynesii]
MVQYTNIVKRKNYLNQLAKNCKVKFYSRTAEEIIEDLIHEGHKEKLDYLNEQFKFSSLHLTLCELYEEWPENVNTPEKLLTFLIEKRNISPSYIDTEWQPPLNPSFQLCAIKHEGSAVYLKFVEEKSTLRKSGYSSTVSKYAQFTSVVLNFGEKPRIQMRCAFTDVDKYIKFVMTFIGFQKPCGYLTVPKLTRENAVKICNHLSAGVASRHILLPTTVGSVQFNGKKGTDLSNDGTFNRITTAIQDLGLPTDHTMEEKCTFKYTDPKTSIEFVTNFEVNFDKGYFKFTKEVPESIVDHVLDILVRVYMEDRISNYEAAVALEE